MRISFLETEELRSRHIRLGICQGLCSWLRDSTFPLHPHRIFLKCEERDQGGGEHPSIHTGRRPIRSGLHAITSMVSSNTLSLIQ